MVGIACTLHLLVYFRGARGEGRGVVGCGHVMKEGKLNKKDENGSRTKVCVD
jgi:hypothetical protein